MTNLTSTEAKALAKMIDSTARFVRLEYGAQGWLFSGKDAGEINICHSIPGQFTVAVERGRFATKTFVTRKVSDVRSGALRSA